MTMTKRERPTFIRLVSDKAATGLDVQKHLPKAASRENRREAWQPMLFPEFNPRVAVAINLDTLSRDGFVELIERVHPKYIVDLRVTPRFDYVGFNRRIAFDFFARVGSAYFDFTGDVGVRDERDARLNPAFVTAYVHAKVCKAKTVSGPLVFLIGSREADGDYVPLLAQHLSTTEAEWQWLKA